MPGLARNYVVDTGIENGPTVAVLDQVDVDVVESERQPKAGPQDAGRHFDDSADGQRLREWIQ
jgi:hypothetical protein